MRTCNSRTRSASFCISCNATILSSAALVSMHSLLPDSADSTILRCSGACLHTRLMTYYAPTHIHPHLNAFALPVAGCAAAASRARRASTARCTSLPLPSCDDVSAALLATPLPVVDDDADVDDDETRAPLSVREALISSKLSSNLT
jgi:hypothetical protein